MAEVYLFRHVNNCNSTDLPLIIDVLIKVSFSVEIINLFCD